MSATYRPKTDVLSRGERFELRLDLPGVPEENLKVEISGERLSLRGEPQELPGTLVGAEFGVGAFERHFRLGAPIEADDLQIKLSGGVLSILLPPCGSVLPEEIEVH